MTLFILAYLAGIFTIATPCILPVLPFVLARADEPFRRGGLPMLLGLAVAFAVVASLASVAGAWAVDANHQSRIIALLLMSLFGATMLLSGLAARITAPLVSSGSWLLTWAGQRQMTRRKTFGSTTATSALLGVATGLVWAPCAGPVLGLILTGAALRGPGIETSLLLLTYGLGAATSLAAGMLLGGRLLRVFKRSAQWGEGLRRILTAMVIVGAAVIWFGLDTALLTRLSASGATHLEQDLISTLRLAPELGLSTTAIAATEPELSAPLTALLGAQQWLNTPPLQAADLRGKVVLVNFWTYSCINCLRVLPHVRAWAEKYKDRGLVVIGVHTPEFAFEKDAANVHKATTALGVGYPVAIDSDFVLWQAFDNDAWPALYFIGADGSIRHTVLGEGEYAQSEQLIQQLLSEASGKKVTGDIAPINATGPQAEADQRDELSGETYLGYAKAENFASSGGGSADAPSLYHASPDLPVNWWSLAGTWTIGGEFATLTAAPGRISYRFHARDLHLVMGSATPDHPIRFRITIDGAPPGADHGSDVDADGWGSVQDNRLYQLVRQIGPITDRTFEIQFFDAGIRAYAFTFG